MRLQTKLAILALMSGGAAFAVTIALTDGAPRPTPDQPPPSAEPIPPQNPPLLSPDEPALLGGALGFGPAHYWPMLAAATFEPLTEVQIAEMQLYCDYETEPRCDPDYRSNMLVGGYGPLWGSGGSGYAY